MFLTNPSYFISVKVDTSFSRLDSSHFVPVNEFHRIFREIKEYLGIDEVKNEIKN